MRSPAPTSSGNPYYVSPSDVGKLAGVDPRLAARIRGVIFTARLMGADVGVVSGKRSQLEQERLYAQGRTTPGPIVTWTRTSAHTTGRAVDLAFRNRGAFDWDVPARAWDILGRIGAAYGLKRTALSKGDLGHFELP